MTQPSNAQAGKTDTEKSVSALLAAFAVEHLAVFENFCGDHGEDASSLLQWRILDWADAYRSDCPSLRAAKSAPLFLWGDAGPPRPGPEWAGAISEYCDAVRLAVGGNPTARWWPYRSGNAVCVAFDAWGDVGEVSVTIVEGDCVNIPLDRRQPGFDEPQVADLVDACYLVALLLESLGLASGKGLDGFMASADRDGTEAGIVLARPDGIERPLARLPGSRAEAIRLARAENAGPGRYRFLRRIDDPDGGEVELTEVAVEVYPGGDVGITELSPASAFTAEACDIAAYVRDRIGPAGNGPLKAVLSSLGDNPAFDMESGRVSLSLEKAEGELLLEFLLEPGGRLALAETSESRGLPLFQCQLPSVRSTVQFAAIVLQNLNLDHARIEFRPLNESSMLIFA